MSLSIRKYLASIGRRGGLASRRVLNSEDAKGMVKVRVARRAYRKYHAQCFWSYRPDLEIALKDVSWVAEQLRKQGGREAWQIAARLSR